MEWSGRVSMYMYIGEQKEVSLVILLVKWKAGSVVQRSSYLIVGVGKPSGRRHSIWKLSPAASTWGVEISNSGFKFFSTSRPISTRPNLIIYLDECSL